MNRINQLNVKLFADGADLDSMLALYKRPYIRGFTTNPTLMKKAGINNYEKFAKQVIEAIPDRPVSFEVFADELSDMSAQAKVIASWGSNVNVKIPVTNTKGIFTGPIIRELSATGVKLNITAVFTLKQVRLIAENLFLDTPAIISVFAGRIAGPYRQYSRPGAARDPSADRRTWYRRPGVCAGNPAVRCAVRRSGGRTGRWGLASGQ